VQSCRYPAYHRPSGLIDECPPIEETRQAVVSCQEFDFLPADPRLRDVGPDAPVSNEAAEIIVNGMACQA
jgi:hypothetical protein